MSRILPLQPPIGPKIVQQPWIVASLFFMNVFYSLLLLVDPETNRLCNNEWYTKYLNIRNPWQEDLQTSHGKVQFVWMRIWERVFETVSPHLVYILIDFLVWLDDDEEFSVCLDKDFSERGEGFVTGCLTWSCLSSPRFLNSSDSRTLARGSAQIVNCCAKQDKCFQIFCVHLKKETWKVE